MITADVPYLYLIPNRLNDDIRQEITVAMLEDQPRTPDEAQAIITRITATARTRQRRAHKRNYRFAVEPSAGDLGNPLVESLRDGIDQLAESDQKVLRLVLDGYLHAGDR